jgi:tRNA (adenine57-N1/adenine58-N1)-methyltransferase
MVNGRPWQSSNWFTLQGRLNSVFISVYFKPFTICFFRIYMMFSPGSPMLLVDERDRQYLFNVPGEDETPVRIRGENLNPALLAAQHDGGVLRTELRRRYLVLKPTLEQVIMNMPRQAQVIYPKDIGHMLMWGDIAPGQTAAEVGCGHGALTMSLLRALGMEGRLISYDIRPDHLNRTRKNIALYLGEKYLERWQPLLKDITSPEREETGPEDEALPVPWHDVIPVQRLFCDIPEPWRLLEAAAAMLRPGGVWVAYIPTALQLMHSVQAMNKSRAFSLAQGFETLQRYWHVRPPSLRPCHGMKAHTGFIVTARRRYLEDEFFQAAGAAAPGK